MSTCPPVPSFSGIRIPPSTGKRALPARRAMPKSRQASTSAASAKTTKTPTTPKADTAKPKLSIALPPPPTSTQRDSGPEDGEISDDEDDHYSPREATTPVHIPFGNSLEATSLNPPIPPLPPPLPSSFNSMNGRQSGDFSTREQLNLNTLRNITDPASMSIQELRKNALGAVMYLACSAKISFDDIVAEGVDRRVLAKYFDQLKLQMPPFEPRDLSKTATATPTPIPTKGPASEAANGIKPIFPTPSAQSLPISTSVGTMANPPASLPPKPPLPTTTTPHSLTPKPESVVSRFNQAIPTLNPTNELISPPRSTPPPELNGQDTPQSAPESSTSATASLRSRKRPVAADFDTEIKPSLLVSKQPRFGNRQSLETSHFIFEVSDNEDDGPKSSRLAPQPAGPSRPDSTTPEHNEKLGESLRQKEQEIEEMRRKIMAMSRKRKLAANGENSSGPPSQSSTPAPITPSAALIEAKDEKLEQVEQFLHQTLDQIEAGNLQPAAMDVAVNLVNSELMDVEAKTAELQLHSSQDRAASEQPSQISTDSASEGAETTASPETDLAPETPFVPLSSDPKSTEEKVPLDDGSLEAAPIELDTAPNGSLDDATGSPMDLSDLESTSSEMESDSEGSSEDGSGSDGSDIEDISSDDDASSDQSDDVEMHDSSLEASPGLDSASSPLHEAADDDGYDPETHKSDIGETSLLSETPGVSQNQPPTVPDFAILQPPKIPTKVLPPKRKDGEYTPYQSALSGFKSFRYHPGYTNIVSQGFKSLTYSNHIDSELPVCDFETRGGTCNDPQCRWQHFRQMVLPEDQILLELSEPDDTQPDKEKYQSSLAETITELNNNGETGDFDKIASNIVEYRRQQLGDPTRIIRNLQ